MDTDPLALPADEPMPTPLVPTPPESAGRQAGSGAALGFAMGVSNALSYFFVVILTRVLGPESFGAYSAINTLGIVLVIPAGVFQIIVAGRWANPSTRTSGLRAATLTGIGLTVATGTLSPAIAQLVHVGSVWPVLAMSLMLLPMTLTGALGGVLLGSHRMTALAGLYLVTALSRLAAAGMCALTGARLTVVFVLTALASAITVAVGFWLARRELTLIPHRHDDLLSHLLHASSTLAAFTALTNIDVILARHFLTGHESGGYGLASTFGRAMAWGTQFVALLVIPKIAHRSSGLMWRAAAGIILIGVCAASAFAVNPEFFVTIVGGHQYDGYGTLALQCVGLGTVWALAQLWLLSSMAGRMAWLGYLTWFVAAVELIVGWFTFHGTPTHIVAWSAACSLVVVVAAAVNTAVTQRAQRS